MRRSPERKHEGSTRASQPWRQLKSKQTGFCRRIPKLKRRQESHHLNIRSCAKQRPYKSQ